MYCKQCGEVFSNDNADVCLKCGTKKGNGKSFCEHCGASVNEHQAVCLNCGARLDKEEKTEEAEEPKSRLVAGLLGIFLGGFGIHNFYLGYNTKAAMQLGISVLGIILSCCSGFISLVLTGAVAIWGLVEGILLLTGSIKKDGKGNPLKS